MMGEVFLDKGRRTGPAEWIANHRRKTHRLRHATQVCSVFKVCSVSTTAGVVRLKMQDQRITFRSAIFGPSFPNPAFSGRSISALSLIHI